MNIDLSGRAAIVTGGSKGIGLGVATRFAASGADVAIVARGAESLEAAVKAIKATAKGRVVGVQGDVAKAADIQRAYDEVMKAFGKVDILVNNAGTSRTGVAYDDYKSKQAKEIPLGRMGKPEEFANLACLLVSDAGGYISGTAINVDGGRSPVV
jgi:NAD(P)-dependent dehydrogenase (short-subunit alcohol dehydrogenase family)